MEKAKTLLEIARIISGNDDDVLAEIEESIDNIEAYAQEHLEEFEERNISIKYDSVEDLQWLVTVNILVRNNYVMQIQEDCSITDFGWSLKSLRTFKEYNLALDSKFEEEDYEIDKYDYNEDDEYDYYNEEIEYNSSGTVRLSFSNNPFRNISGNCPFRQSLIKRFPKYAPLPSSPKIYPSGDIFCIICLPSYKHEFDPVPNIQAIPALSLHKARAAPSKSVSTAMLASGKLFCKTCMILSVLGGRHPAP